MLSLRDQILKRFRTRWREGNTNFSNSQAIQEWAHLNAVHKTKGAHFKHETVGRCLRSLAEEGLLERMEENSVSYRYAPSREELLGNHMRIKLYDNH